MGGGESIVNQHINSDNTVLLQIYLNMIRLPTHVS
jgi:hypothetical protein